MSTDISIEPATPMTPSTRPAPLVGAGPTRWAAVAGIIFVALQAPLPFIMGDVPAIDAPAAEIRDYLVSDGGRILLAMTLVALAACFFLWFLAGLRTHLHRAEGGDGRLSALAFGAGIATITLNLTATMPTVALAWNDTAASADTGLLRTVWNLSTLALVPIGSTAGLFALAVALIILRTGARPAWLGWLGLLTTILSVASVFYLLADGSNAVLEAINMAGFLVAMVFILLLSILMVHRPAEVAVKA